jgi:hypothetical protein
MGGSGKGEAETGTEAQVPDLRPWREVGWIFRDGNCIAIERQPGDTDSPALVD